MVNYQDHWKVDGLLLPGPPIKDQYIYGNIFKITKRTNGKLQFQCGGIHTLKHLAPTD